jgi:hypothetical protein
MARALIVLVSLALLCGCICSPSTLSGGGKNQTTTEGTSEKGDKGPGGLLGGLFGGGKKDSTTPDHCIPPAEAAGLTLRDCEKLKNPFEKAACAGTVALNTGDPKACGILGKELNAACVANLAGCRKDLSLCEPLGADDLGLQYACEGEVAAALKDASVCDHMENPRWKDPCIRGVAAAKGEPGLCEGSSGKFERDKCVAEVATAADDGAICELLQDKLYWYDDCVKTAAQATGDIMLCQKIDPSLPHKKEKLQECILNVSAAKGDPKECAKVKDPEMMSWCLIPLAKTLSDASACAPIQDMRVRGICVTNVAAEKKDAALCSTYLPKKPKSISGSDELNDCLSAVAKAARDKRICEGITDNKFDKQDCIKAAG